MQCFDLTKLKFFNEEDNLPIENFYQLDNIFISSSITNQDQIDYLKDQGIDEVIDFKMAEENVENVRELFLSNGIRYHNYSIKNLNDVTHEFLEKVSEIIRHQHKNKLLFCRSGNRAAAVMAMHLCKICGHSKKRSLEAGMSIGLTNSELINSLREK